MLLTKTPHRKKLIEFIINYEEQFTKDVHLNRTTTPLTTKIKRKNNQVIMKQKILRSYSIETLTATYTFSDNWNYIHEVSYKDQKVKFKSKI